MICCYFKPLGKLFSEAIHALFSYNGLNCSAKRMHDDSVAAIYKTFAKLNDINFKRSES